MKAIFIAGTDTGVGKTVVTGCLARYLLEEGYKAITQKWIQTGCRISGSSDIKLHLKIMGLSGSDVKTCFPYILPYVFKEAASPHLASKLENKRISVDRIKKSFIFLSKQFDYVIIEGLGGVLVPLNRKKLVIDIVKELDLPVLLVVGNRLGAINHTLLTIEALHARKIKILGLVFNNLGKENKTILYDNPRIIRALTKERIFGILPRESSYREVYKRFFPIAQRIIEAL